jgi:hypothetical protein
VNPHHSRWERPNEVAIIVVFLLRRRTILYRRCVGVDGGSIRGLL